ncbi:MAG: hypothetical protein ACRDXC_00385, partial [Acidimicrobiales bacterium]
GLLVAEAAREAAAERAEEQALARKQAARQAAEEAAAQAKAEAATRAERAERAGRRPRSARVVEAVNLSSSSTPGQGDEPAQPAASTSASTALAPTASYANPLRSVGGLVPERIDQGVDYRGFGPIYAVGDGVVLSTYNGGWPGGTFITYRLSDGPAAGLVVYAAEDISPAVQPGEAVTSDTVLGTVYEGPDGIETGWAAGGEGDTMAAVSGQFYGSNSTAFGADFSAFLETLGAPGGILQNSPPSGAMPLGWPGW